MRVAVGSLNPIKITAAEQAFHKVWPTKIWQVTGFLVASGVRAQPLSASESITGALNRALQALKKGQASYGVGLEGGLELIGDHWFACGWMVVVDRFNRQGIGSTVRLVVPPPIVAQIQQGQELGEVVDQIFHTHNAKHGDGYFGLMTNNQVTRTAGYTDGVIMALTRFIHPRFFTISS